MIGKEPQISIVVGVILTFVAIISATVTGTSSITAWIPAFFGVPIAILGALALNPNRLKTMMHIVAGLALLGAVGSLNVIPDLFGGSASTASIVARLAMLLLCGGLLYVSVMSFIQTRRNKRKEV